MRARLRFAHDVRTVCGHVPRLTPLWELMLPLHLLLARFAMFARRYRSRLPNSPRFAIILAAGLATRPWLNASLLALAFVAAAQGVHAQTSPVRVRRPGYNQPLSLDSAATRPEAIAAARDVTIAAAKAVLEELSVPVTTEDTAAGLMGNTGFMLLRRLGNERLSKYLSCGVGLSGAQADTWRVTMAVMVWIDGAGRSASRVKVGLLAGARDLDTGSRRSAGCGSTGALEVLIVDRIRRRAAAL